MHKMTKNHDALSDVGLSENEKSAASPHQLPLVSAPADLDGWVLTPAQRIFIESLLHGLDSAGQR